MHSLPLLFSYFRGNHSQAFLAFSRDGLSFEPLNSGRPILEAAVGSEGLIRDPAIVTGPDGVLHMLWTTGWCGRDIGYARSRDLAHWSAPRAIPLPEAPLALARASGPLRRRGIPDRPEGPFSGGPYGLAPASPLLCGGSSGRGAAGFVGGARYPPGTYPRKSSTRRRPALLSSARPLSQADRR